MILKKEWIQSFQSTFPRGERQLQALQMSLRLLFQSTFPRGERLLVCLISDVLNIFQSTFPRGERQYKLLLCHRIITFQSTFPRGERQSLNEEHVLPDRISIHVPAWGTTAIIPKMFSCILGIIPKTLHINYLLSFIF